MDRRLFLKRSGLALAAGVLSGCIVRQRSIFPRRGPRKPNLVVILCDDLGYGDIGCFGSKLHRTPNIDRLASGGMRFTSFYVTSGVCTPSRASLLTGCYPRRVGMHQAWDGSCVLLTADKKGLNPDEITIADMLKEENYATACIGKWHLGDQKEFLPNRQGFDYYYGLPYSNDMDDLHNKRNPPLPLLRNEEVIEAPAEQHTLTKRYTQEAVRFIKEHKDEPFFLYLPHTMPHYPVQASRDFRGRSANKVYGDAVEEIDWSTGQILECLRENGIADNTLVIFTSDNGADEHFGGSNLPLRDWKGTTWEGGMRVPCVMRWPGVIPEGRSCDQLCSTMDLLPTFAACIAVELPADRVIDGKDIRPLMSGAKDVNSPHKAFYYYQKDQLQAVRSGKWKLHLPLKMKKRNWGEGIPDVPLQLYNLDNDIGERENVVHDYPKVVKKLLALAEKAKQNIGDVNTEGPDNRSAGIAKNPKPIRVADD